MSNPFFCFRPSFPIFMIVVYRREGEGRPQNHWMRHEMMWKGGDVKIKCPVKVFFGPAKVTASQWWFDPTRVCQMASLQLEGDHQDCTHHFYGRLWPAYEISVFLEVLLSRCWHSCLYIAQSSRLFYTSFLKSFKRFRYPYTKNLSWLVGWEVLWFGGGGGGGGAGTFCLLRYCLLNLLCNCCFITLSCMDILFLSRFPDEEDNPGPRRTPSNNNLWDHIH